MKSERAKQIIDSKKYIPVYYKNTPVHIEKVDNKENIAHIKSLNTDKEIVVNVKTLSECNKLNN
ncbi:H-type small acid-soluble spore protein [Clostridium botulinum]|uniref:Small, acid-soluble spore protein H 2 n=5 Tax=Clostridium TaxID=1485 RepID=SSPH2_CLOBH|nr:MULTISPECIES: H-type small acid-soluble spore protein [Clostridium]A5I174.1 RecName: Full=Small, acid-soluble spore protein H 2; Short=SASP H 2 [Clostridium botulinum A str. Hall]A7FTB7.1 RecName: Full=Small, acid-soluble spore protein H 2; Short=SASP H 2 [Clostridium botulinum A str. ATCC 19397]A7GCS6.1 RecName: Full=Small, acid-soluble spore protein H 2; Short=SASP H 2 [Clostridium botulinum F str. Langeland]EKX80171.1 small acid-soluble spore protein, H-type [Clostridium botulinum CFSAN00